ncbi:MAG: YhjD/YihY/BrkB family envelope integrity protein [Deferribacterales bacterium]
MLLKSKLEKIILSFIQRMVISYTYFLRNELRNHAAAAAYYLLLSLIPLVLFFFYIFDTFLAKYPNFSDELFYLLSTISDSLSPQMFSELGISKQVGGAIGIVGLLNLVWSSRLVLLALQRAFFVIFPAEQKRNFFLENGVAFIILPLVFTIVLALSMFSGAKGFILEYIEFYGIAGPVVIKALGMVSMLVSGFIGFIIIFLSYKYLPVKKPDAKSALSGTLLFLVLYTLVKFAAFKLFHMFSINTAYGIIGSIIVILMWAYFVFMIFLFCAQFVFVCYRADILILNMLFSSERPSALFMRMNRHLLMKYTHRLKEGDTLFNQGDESYDIYYLQEGQLNLIIEGRHVGHIHEGEIFGEMAHITGETRSATITADTESRVLKLSPKKFDEILKDNSILSRRIITTLCSRLRKTDMSLKASESDE